jgi:hypothetical protein
MSVRFDASTDMLSRSGTGTNGVDSSGSPANSTWSVCFWCKRQVDTGAFATAMSYGYAGVRTYLETDSGGDIMTSDDFDGSADTVLNGPTITVGTWFFFAYSRTNTSRTLWYGTEAGGTLSKVGPNTDTRTWPSTPSGINFFSIGNDDAQELFNGDIAFARFWQGSVFSDAEADAEWRSTTPVKSSVRGDWRLATAAAAGTDSSGNGLTLTVGGTLANGSADPTPPSGGTPVTLTPGLGADVIAGQSGTVRIEASNQLLIRPF